MTTTNTETTTVESTVVETAPHDPEEGVDQAQEKLTPELAEEHGAASEPSPAEPAEEVENPAAAKKAREASKLRERLRATTERLEAMQRNEAERLAAGKLGTGADLWAGGVALSDLLDDDGNLSADLVDQAARSVGEQHPHWRRPTAPPASSVTGTGKITGGGKPSFAEAFAPRNR